MSASGDGFHRAIAGRPWLVRGWPFVVFALSPFIVYPWGFIRNGLLDGGDDVLSNLPMLLHSARALLRLEVFWTPALWLGTPLLEEPEFGTFYLPHLGLLVLPPVTAFAIYVLVHYVLAQVSFFAYARSLDLSRGAAVFGAFAYAFSGFMMGHRGHTMYLVAGAWAPLFFAFLRRLELGRGRFDVLGATLSFAALPLCGAMQLTAYLVLAAVVLQGTRAALLRTWRPLGLLVLVLVPATLVGALQILPSLGLSAQVVDLPGDRYAFATLLSYDPKQLPLLLAPLDPSSCTELYSHIGGIALAFVCVAVAYRRDDVVLAWCVVSATALVLMLGRHVPVLPHVLESLPIVDVFRGPVRHNFELGLAASVLSAIGFDAAFAGERASHRIWIWLAGALVVAVVAWVLGVAATRSSMSLQAASALAKAAEHGPVRVGAIALGLGVAAVGFAGTRVRRSVLVLVSFAPLFDARYSVRTFDRVWPDFAEELSTADVRSGVTTDFVRVLPPPMSLAGPDALAANTALAIPGLGHLLGYASRVHRDVAAVFDTDMHGFPREPDDLAWSRLPETFGASYLILPEAICAPVDCGVRSVAPDEACGEGHAAVDLSLGARELRCHEPLTEGRARLRVEARRPRAPVPTAMRVDFVGRGPRAFVDTLEFRKRQFGQWLSDHAPPPHGWMTVSALEPRRLEVENVQLIEEALQPIVNLDAHARPELFGATATEDSLRLAPDGPVVRAEKAFDWPPWLRSSTRRRFKPLMELEVVARADTPPSNPLIADLYAGPKFDPVSAQMAVDPRALGRFFAIHTAPAEAVDPPAKAALRVLLEGRGAVEVERARLLAEHRRSLVELAGRRDATGTDFGIESNVSVGPRGVAKVEYHLPMRPVQIELVVYAVGGGERTLAFGIRADPGTSARLEWQHSVVVDPARSRRYTLTAALPPTAGEIEPFAAALKGSPVQVLRLALHDACSSKLLVPLRTLDSGWVVYRDEGALPRAFTVGEARIVQSLEDARHVLRDDVDFDPRKTALLLPDARVPKNLVSGIVEHQEFGAETVEVRVRAVGGPTLLVINDRYHDRWRATVDGVATSIDRANGLVRAVVVPEGTHVVRMRYVPPWTIPAGAASAVLGLVLGFSVRRRSPRK